MEYFATRAAARARVSAWIEDYNQRRRHSGRGMMSPAGYERALQAGEAARCPRFFAAQYQPAEYGSYREAGIGKISQIEVSTLSAESRNVSERPRPPSYPHCWICASLRTWPGPIAG